MRVLSIAALTVALIGAIALDDRASAQASSKEPRLVGDAGKYFGPENYPVEALKANEQGRVVTNLSVNLDGHVTACAIVESSGSPALDTGTCLIASNIPYDAAVDNAGKPINSTFRLPVRWSIPQPAVGDGGTLVIIQNSGTTLSCTVELKGRLRHMKPKHCSDLVEAVRKSGGPTNIPVSVTLPDEALLDD